MHSKSPLAPSEAPLPKPSSARQGGAAPFYVRQGGAKPSYVR
jgi:hypothetical protein